MIGIKGHNRKERQIVEVYFGGAISLVDSILFCVIDAFSQFSQLDFDPGFGDR